MAALDILFNLSLPSKPLDGTNLCPSIHLGLDIKETAVTIIPEFPSAHRRIGDIAGGVIHSLFNSIEGVIDLPRGRALLAVLEREQHRMASITKLASRVPVRAK